MGSTRNFLGDALLNHIDLSGESFRALADADMTEVSDILAE